LEEETDVEKLVETSIRLSPGTLERLRLKAHLMSIESGTTVTWNALVRSCVERHLLGGEGAGGTGPTPAAAGG
jgi:hypothetical protein